MPLSLIVLAIVAALVLVLIIAFTVGGAGSTFSRIFKVGAATGGEELELVKAGCRQACSTAQSSVRNSAEWVSSSYCSRKASVDLNGNGKLENGKENNDNVNGVDITDETGLRCWHGPINIGCSFPISTETGTKTVVRDTVASDNLQGLDAAAKPAAEPDCKMTDIS